MRLSIDHRTVYRFSEPQGRIVQMLRMTPQNSHDQTVANWDIHVDCDARMREGRDGFGNQVTMLYVEGPVAGIEIAVTGEVLTSASDGLLHGVEERFPPALFLRATDATPQDDDVAAFARSFAACPAGLRDLTKAMHDRFGQDRGRPMAGLDAGAAFVRDRATPRDMAQMFAVAARSLGVPARYVSGYLLGERDHRPTPHGWAEAFLPGQGWTGFDPWHGAVPGEEYVRVAVALDAAGAAPVAGSRLGDGDEELDVDVQVTVAA